jgi:glycosyltransferase involved in cell wall biosynthesis
MKTLPISVFIITKDEEERLPRVVDEIIVVDSGSTDKTVEIASEMGCKVMFNKWNGYGLQKIFGEQQCRNDWVLNIDADEEITPELRQRIEALFANGRAPSEHAFKMFWKMVFIGQKKPPLIAVGSNFIRLYNKKYAGFSDSAVHDSVLVKDKGKIGVIKGAYVHHRCFRSMQHWGEKINFYSAMQAEDWVAKGRALSNIRIIFEPFATFFKSYLVRGYIFYGIDGFLASLMYAHARTLRLAKVRELYRLKNNV